MNPSTPVAAGSVLEGRRVGAGPTAAPVHGEVTYVVVEPAAAERARGDQRAWDRRRTRLRSGKLTDVRRRFVIECIFHDRSVSGARLRLIEDVPLPVPLMVYDDETGTLVGARVVWRNRHDVGVRFGARAAAAAAAIKASLGGNFYAVPRRR